MIIIIIVMLNMLLKKIEIGKLSKKFFGAEKFNEKIIIERKKVCV